MGELRKRSQAAVVVGVLVLGLGAACSANSSDFTSAEKRARPATGGPMEAKAGPAAVALSSGRVSERLVASDPTVGDQVGGPSTPLPPGLGAPKVVKTANLVVRLEEGRFARAFSQVATIAAANGGFVASSSSMAGTDKERLAAGTVVVRIPADRFDETRRQVVGLGRLASEELRGQDVGGQLADLEARLRNLRSQEEAIRALMARATTVGETIQVQQQLSAVREQVEQLSGEQARLSDAAAFSTLTISLSEPGVATDGGESPLGRSLGRALDGAEVVLAGAILALGYAVPLGALALVGWAAARTVVRSRRVVAPSPPAAA